MKQDPRRSIPARHLRFLLLVCSCSLTTILTTTVLTRAVLASEKETATDRNERAFKLASLGGDPRGLLDLMRKAEKLPEPEVARLLIPYALTGSSREVDAEATRILSKLENPAALRTIYTQTYLSKNYRTRILLHAIVYEHRQDVGAMKALLRGLTDKKREVVLSALSWIRRSGDRRVIKALISALERREKTKGHIYYEILYTLRAITGEEYESVGSWENYFQRISTGKKPPAAGSRIHKEKFFGLPIESEVVVFVIDVSESMDKRDLPYDEFRKLSGNGEIELFDFDSLPRERGRLNRVKKELARSIELLPKEVRFTVQAFSSSIQWLNDAPVLLPANPTNKSAAIRWVRHLEPGGETYTDEAIRAVFKGVPQAETIFLLSDGAPRRNNKPLPPEEVLRDIVHDNRFTQVKINTIGFSSSGTNLKKFLRQLARESGGEVAFVP